MTSKKAPACLMLLSVLLFSVVATGQEFDLSWHTMDGGGAMRSTGGDFELSGTIGQPDAGLMAGGAFTLSGGFWFAIPPGDCDDTGNVDLLDTDLFHDCLTGPDGPAPVGTCRCFDINQDGVVDMADFAEIQTNFTG